jgi:two-component system OmpR family sensor kinase
VTLRARLVAILAILFTLGLLASGLVTYGALRDFLYERVDSQLVQTRPLAIRALLDSARGAAGFPALRGDPAGLPIAAYAEVRNENGDIIQRVAFGFEGVEATHVPDISSSVAAGQREPFTARAEDDRSYRFRVLATPTIDGGTLIVAIPLADAQETLQRLLGIEVLVALLLIAGVAFMAWAIIRKELRPLDEMAGAATQIAAGDLSRRVDESNPRSEVGRLGRALNRMLEQIEQAFEARRTSEERMRRFLGDASHELRTPLTSIRGYAELFRRGAGERPQDLSLSLRRIEDEAARMGVLVDELILLANADQTRPFATDEVDLTAIVHDAAEDARARDPARTIKLEIDEHVDVTGDEVRLRQALDNLVANALVHTPDGTPIRLALSRVDGAAVVMVEDAGPGLDPEALEHAFDRFWRRDPSRSRDTGGSGLGLAIVDAIVRGHGGTITADNVDTGGARFSVRLPIHS